jgi:hypothetical protein
VSACPTCGKPVQKLLSAPAIQFKGTGWYITDYARKNSTGAGKSDGAPCHVGQQQERQQGRHQGQRQVRLHNFLSNQLFQRQPASGSGSSS